MRYEMDDKRWDSIKAYLDKAWKRPDKYPDRGLLLSLSDEEMTQLFTKKRLELLRLIRKKHPKNATQLAGLSNRRLSAVMRDLELLESLHIVSLEKKGKTIVPRVEKELLILPLVELRAKELAEIKAVA
jgi:predicted transcriptional regulator